MKLLSCVCVNGKWAASAWCTDMLKQSLVCRMLLQYAIYKCVAVGVAYVAPFYFRDSHARNHPSTIKFRMASTVATSLLAWLPLYHQMYNKVTHSPSQGCCMCSVQRGSSTCNCPSDNTMLQNMSTLAPQHVYV